MLSSNSRDNKSLKVLSDSISESLIFQNFLGGGHAPRFGMHALHARSCAPHIIIMFDSLQCICAPPFVNPGSAPVIVLELIRIKS